MTSLAQNALSKLLKRAENAAAKPEGTRAISLRFSESSFSAYFDPRLTREDRTHCHGELELAKRAGAIDIVWDRRAGLGNQIEVLRLLDAAMLAQFMGVNPRWDVVNQAENELKDVIARHPVLQGAFSVWRTGKRVCNTTAADFQRWIDAAKVLDRCRDAPAKDVPIRRFSTQVLGNSKKVKTLTPLLNVLLLAELDAPSREDEEILNELGLVRYPPTVLLGGAVSVTTTKNRTVRVDEPYLGLPPDAIKHVEYLPSCSNLMTIENLETFHEVARLAANRADWVVLYTGGMPSPSWKGIFSLFLKALPSSSTIWHWGDIDVGGFRIADHIAACCAAQGRTLFLNRMVVPTDIDFGSDNTPRQLKPNELILISKVCESRGWMAEIQALMKTPFAIEQEILDVTFPRLV
jgi:Uncharacterized protein conserved in bacteria C-term(DUF2220)